MVALSYCKGIKRCVNEVGVGFMMSANYHPAMKILRPVRKELKIKTVFNILGPLLNPARVPYAVIGVYHEEIVSFMWSLLEVIQYELYKQVWYICKCTKFENLIKLAGIFSQSIKMSLLTDALFELLAN
jgi:anthranilate phosphoribosyltransferase